MTKNNKVIIWSLSVIAVILCAVLLFILGTNSSSHSTTTVQKKSSKGVKKTAQAHSSSKPQVTQPSFTNEELAAMTLVDLGKSDSIDQKLDDAMADTTEQVDPRQAMLMQIKQLSDNSFQFQEGTAGSTRLIVTINGDTIDHKISNMIGEHSEGTLNKKDLINRYRDKKAQIDELIQKINYNDQHSEEINQKLMDDVLSGKDDH
ncbi:hypothetical protein HMPREF0501_01294 [Limosilactobacillus coleohominis 101-4-CHN]|uniref:Uncharacterized protein n=1 Tax=Limosilactobacillus coleohominis 101-4-CHN TaxID=575594 RepID=C7XX09_9LACO|nr:hypothetical protein [Limosilactobacillus coleohominis]EEU29829.1 hypothetical protein HMPREF0501_01294 [Limosilactobacillus coleohominis 101-4-CHN]